MKLIACGDSWTWGDELVDPIEEPVPIMNIPNGFDRHQKEVNRNYRLKHRYINIVKENLNATELVDLSYCSISNEAIQRKLFNYLAEEGYLSGKSTDDLFVTIGWTSPGRTEFYWKKKWGNENYIPFGPWSLEQDHKDEDLNTFFKIYFDNFLHPEEYIHKWILTVFNTQLLLQKYNIKYVMFQAFFHPFYQSIHFWDDKQYKNEVINSTISLGDIELWKLIDTKRFMHKDNDEHATCHNYLLKHIKNLKEAFIEFHPSAKGHQIWGDHMSEYVIQNKLC